MDKMAIVFPILNNLTPTVESCTMKVLEEVGELMQLIGKGQNKSGEATNMDRREWVINSIKESMDVAQSAITMMETLGRTYGIDLDAMMEEHEAKLIAKGYYKYD